MSAPLSRLIIKAKGLGTALVQNINNSQALHLDEMINDINTLVGGGIPATPPQELSPRLIA